MEYEYWCRFCGCLWSSSHCSNRCPDCNSEEFKCGHFTEGASDEDLEEQVAYWDKEN